MIKLVASDIDGTLVPEGTNRINPEIFEMIRELKKRGIIFVAASGRQYASMKHVFAPVEDDIIFIAENGSNVMCRGRSMFTSYIAPDTARELVGFLRDQEDCEIILSTPDTLYFETQRQGFRSFLEDGYNNQVSYVEDLLPYCAKTNKISAYKETEVEALGEKIKKRFGDRLNVAIAGSIWIDTMNLTVDKGRALETIQSLMKISREETMVFGDNCNDIGMIRQASESYAVANAHPQLREAAKYIAKSQEEDGVICAIRERLLGK